jgi:hypothetical protein
MRFALGLVALSIAWIVAMCVFPTLTIFITLLVVAGACFGDR